VHFSCFCLYAMARLLSNMVLKGVARPTCSFSSVVALEGFLHEGVKYSTVSNDTESHDDFKPNNKLADSGISIMDIVEKDVKENPVMIYMKGVPDAPRCGFSALAVRVLKEYGKTP
ncbi:hypothetical protein Taro_051801, partial [Colocasia esculenta]|nr:hypothetical protein [Colocasia esculenta]